MPQASFWAARGCCCVCECGVVAVVLVLWLVLLRLLLERSRGCLFQVVSALWLVMLPPVALATKPVPTSES